jgi:UDP-3-O-[3-hydroxymyristoyl] glucosamine N-acyltransferase
MKLSELQAFDSNIKVVSNPEWPGEIQAISALEQLLPNSLVFIKSDKFLKKFLPQVARAAELKVGVVLDAKLFDSIKPEERQSLATLPWLATSGNVSLSLTLLSKPFHDRKLGGINSQVDGRQMGTVDIDPSAHIAQNVFIGEYVKIAAGVEIMPGSVILSHSEIGAGTKIWPNVTIYPFVSIGRNCRIHSGTVIGADGYGYTFHQGRHLKIWHMGGVRIEDEVEIGSNSSVDAGTFSPTIIGAGSKLDNQVQVAHNCRVGKGCIMCGQSGLAGSVTLEDFVVLGGKAAIGPDAHLGMGTQVAGGAGVPDGAIWPAGSKIGGHPARDIREWMRGMAYIRKHSLKESK